MKTSVLSFLVVISLVLMGSCSSSKKAQRSEADITSLQWRMVSVKSSDGSELLIPPAEHVPNLVITKEGQASGFAGCNRFHGPVKVDGMNIKFENMALTRMYCMETMHIEEAYMNVLNAVDNYAVDKGNLYLQKGNEILATFTSQL